ncbi:MAG TPA: helix-turn-helix domain-containing protein [Pseudolabrys sp.]
MSASLEPLALSPADAAKFLSISKRALSLLIADGALPARKFGRRTLVDVVALKAYYATLAPKTNTGSLPCAPVPSSSVRS